MPCPAYNEAMTPPSILVKDLSYRYRTRDKYALRGCTFDARAGELVLIAGASGCGKTTLMRCLNGLIPRSYTGGDLSGTIRLLGDDPTPLKLAAISQMVGTVLQDPEKQIVGAYVLNEVAFGLENLGIPRDEIIQRVDEVLAFLDIAHLRDRETFALSGGEKQKVAIAGALVMEPDIVLLDEPLASLDPVSARETLQLTRQLVDAGKTVLLIEHRVEDALSIEPDLALFLEDGEQQYFGEIDGFLDVVNPRDVKLPAPIALRKLRTEYEDGTRARHEHEHERRPESAPIASMEAVTFGYSPEQTVLHEITVDIRTGDVVAVLGPNGAGKSTLLRHIIGLLKPRAGRIMLEGRDTSTLTTAQIARSVGYVFQSPTHMLFAPTVREELSFGPRNLGFDNDRIRRNVARSIEILDIEELADMAPLSLSFGQQRRVGIAAILAMESKLLLMDEPTAGQDYRHYIHFMDAIVQMPFDAVVFITHDIDLAVRYATRVILLTDGRIRADGAPEDVLADRSLLEECRLVPTSLLDLNLRTLPETGKFLPLEVLAEQRRMALD